MQISQNKTDPVAKLFRGQKQIVFRGQINFGRRGHPRLGFPAR